jgi:hypothetical protein
MTAQPASPLPVLLPSWVGAQTCETAVYHVWHTCRHASETGSVPANDGREERAVAIKEHALLIGQRFIAWQRTALLRLAKVEPAAIGVVAACLRTALAVACRDEGQRFAAKGDFRCKHRLAASGR